MHASGRLYMACKVQRDSVEYTDVDNEGLASFDRVSGTLHSYR